MLAHLAHILVDVTPRLVQLTYMLVQLAYMLVHLTYILVDMGWNSQDFLLKFIVYAAMLPRNIFVNSNLRL